MEIIDNNTKIPKNIIAPIIGPKNINIINCKITAIPQSDQKLLNDISDTLIDKTKFKLPEAFLKKWMQFSNKKDINENDSEEEFKRSEKGIRYQIIESKIINENKLELNSDELKKFASNMVKNQMFQYGQIPEEKQVEGIVSNILSKKDEMKRISDHEMRVSPETAHFLCFRV